MSLAPVVGDGLVGGPVDLPDAHGSERRASGRVEVRGTGHAGDRGDHVGVVARHPVRHEAPVGDPEEVDPRGVDAVVRPDVVDDPGEVGGVVDLRTVCVAAPIGRVPELISRRIPGAVGVDVEEAPLLGHRLHLEAGFHLRPAACIAVQEHHQGDRGRSVVGRKGRGPVRTDGRSPVHHRRLRAAGFMEGCPLGRPTSSYPHNPGPPGRAPPAPSPTTAETTLPALLRAAWRPPASLPQDPRACPAAPEDNDLNDRLAAFRGLAGAMWRTLRGSGPKGRQVEDCGVSWRRFEQCGAIACGGWAWEGR